VRANARPMSEVNPFSPVTIIQRTGSGPYRDSRLASCFSKNARTSGKAATRQVSHRSTGEDVGSCPPTGMGTCATASRPGGVELPHSRRCSGCPTQTSREWIASWHGRRDAARPHWSSRGWKDHRWSDHRRRFTSVGMHQSDWFWTAIVNGGIPPWEGAADSQTTAMIRAATATGVRLATAGFTTVLDGILGPWHFGPRREESAACKAPVNYVVLRPDGHTYLARAQGESWSRQSIETP